MSTEFDLSRFGPKEKLLYQRRHYRMNRNWRAYWWTFLPRWWR